MIVFNLECKVCGISFEGWFANSKDFNKQKKQKIVNCPSCNSTSVKKTLVAPNLSKKSNSKQKKINKAIASNISKYKKIVEENFDYVGDKFTEEAKKIKYSETKDRPIYGEATIEQTKELIEEEIDIMPLPFSPKRKSN